MHKFIFFLFLTIAAFGAVDANAQERKQDREITYSVRFAKGKSSITIPRRIALGTSHNYILSAREGQTMKIVLTTGNKTAFTLHAPSGDIIENGDGVKIWRGTLESSGEYSIVIGTDKTADYRLEIFIK